MFYVRPARAPPPNLESDFPKHAACAATARPPSRPAPRPASYALVSTRQRANSLSAANKLHIRCAWTGNSEFTRLYGSSWGPGSCTSG
eukprot:scaffold30426_cov61-Phaeocystis_antarctica.AAC.3